MAKRCNLTNIPDQVYELILEDGRRRSESVPQTIGRILCDHYLSDSTQIRHEADKSRTHIRHKADMPPTNGNLEKSDAERVGRKKFVPPTEIEAQKEWELKGYHFSVPEFIAHYGRQGWKLGNGRAMADWKLTMVTWEERWREKHQADGQAAVGTQEYDTSGNKAMVERLKAGKGW